MQYYPRKLKRFFRDRKIEVVLFDLDDTLIDTNAVFLKRVDYVLDHLSSKLSLDHKKLSARFEEELVKAHHKVAVNPNKLWIRVLTRCSATFDLDEDIINEAVEMLLGIYTIVPEILPGVISSLEAITRSKKFLGLVTHANREWTDFKLRSLDLENYFEHVELFDINIHKNTEAWKSAIKAFNVQPQNALVIGDSVKGDIQAAHEAGVRNLVWVNRDGAWDVYKEGELPEGAVEIRGIHELLEKLCDVAS